MTHRTSLVVAAMGIALAAWTYQLGVEQGRAQSIATSAEEKKTGGARSESARERTTAALRIQNRGQAPCGEQSPRLQKGERAPTHPDERRLANANHKLSQYATKNDELEEQVAALQDEVAYQEESQFKAHPEEFELTREDCWTNSA